MIIEKPRYRYCVDAHDVIIAVDPWWLAFAKENGAAELTADCVLGTSLWNYIDGGAVQRIYRDLHERLRASGRSAVLPYRCDSPTVRREMQLKVTPAQDGRLWYESVIVRATPIPYLRFFDAAVARSDAVLTVCSQCRRALLEPDGWIDLSAANDRLRTAQRRGPPNLRNSLCPDCSAVVDAAPPGPSSWSDEARRDA